MKRLLTVTALSTLIAVPAFGQMNNLRDNVMQRLESMQYEVDESSLTDEQVRALYARLAAAEDPVERNRVVDSILEDENFVMNEEMEGYEQIGADSGIRQMVENEIDAYEVDVDVSTLTDAQVTALYLELTSGETSASGIEAIVN